MIPVNFTLEPLSLLWEKAQLPTACVNVPLNRLIRVGVIQTNWCLTLSVSVLYSANDRCNNNTSDSRKNENRQLNNSIIQTLHHNKPMATATHCTWRTSICWRDFFYFTFSTCYGFCFITLTYVVYPVSQACYVIVPKWRLVKLILGTRSCACHKQWGQGTRNTELLCSYSQTFSVVRQRKSERNIIQ